MNLKSRLLGLALGTALLAPAAAFAHDHDHDWWDRDDHERWERRYDHRNCHRAPPPPPGQRGRYEWQTVSVWVDGRWTQEVVPARCEISPWSGRQRCYAEHYERRWQPGHYESVQQWVWVPYSHGWRHWNG